MEILRTFKIQRYYCKMVENNGINYLLTFIVFDEK